MLLFRMRTLIRALLVTTALGSWAVSADEVNTNQAPAAAAAPVPVAQATNVARRKQLSPEDRAEYARLTKAEVELSTRLKVLGELAQEHLQRAEDSKAGAPEKSRWETDLAHELRDKSSVALEQLNTLTKQRLAFEAVHPPTASLVSAPLNEPRALTPDEFVYVTKLEERLLIVRQELVANAETARGFHAELQTNNTPEDMERISLRLDENARQSRQWEREQFDLELKQLEFRALRK
jgi:hypothetical protein